MPHLGVVERVLTLDLRNLSAFTAEADLENREWQAVRAVSHPSVLRAGLVAPGLQHNRVATAHPMRSPEAEVEAEVPAAGKVVMGVERELQEGLEA